MEEVSVIIKLYEEIAVLSESMVKAAEQGNWDVLIQLDRSIRTLRTQLARMDDDSALSTIEHERKASLIEHILTGSKKVRQHTALMMTQARKLYDDSQRLRDEIAAREGLSLVAMDRSDIRRQINALDQMSSISQSANTKSRKTRKRPR